MIDFLPDDTPELRAWRAEVRAFLAEVVPGGMHFDYDFDESPEGWEKSLDFWRKVGAKGWIGLTWPKEYHGLGRSAIERWILWEEFANWPAPGFPVIGHAVSWFLLRHGSHEQKLRHLKGIADCTILWGEGYTEPSSGSDLASLTTRAHRDGDDWIINGQKTFGTAAHQCQWMAVFARTDPNARPHEGISCFLVPLDTPGIQMLPMHNMAGGQQNQTFFENVRVPHANLVGDVNQAWSQIWFHQGGQNLDQPGHAPDVMEYRMLRTLKEVFTFCRETKRGGKPLIEDPVVRLQLAELVEGMEIIKLQSFELHSTLVNGTAEGWNPLGGVFNQIHYREFWPHFAQVCMDIVGPLAQIEGGRWAQLQGRIEHYFRGSFGNHAGGTAQLKRMTAATRGLGLPR